MPDPNQAPSTMKIIILLIALTFAGGLCSFSAPPPASAPGTPPAPPGVLPPSNAGVPPAPPQALPPSNAGIPGAPPQPGNPSQNGINTNGINGGNMPQNTNAWGAATNNWQNGATTNAAP